MLKFFSLASSRNQSLDVLRFIAVLMILGRHSPQTKPECSATLFQFTELWKQGSWFSIDLFFVLSGFLISGLLFKEYKKYGFISVKHFYIRRGFKIYPPFYFFLLVSIILWMIADPSHITTRTLIGELIFFQNYLGGIWGHTWTLAIEEHFYFTLPIFLLLILKYRKDSDDPFRLIVRLALFACFLALIFRILNSYRSDLTHETYFFPTHLRFDSLTLGVLISYYYNFHHEKLERFVMGRRLLLFIIGVCLIIPPLFYPLETTPFMYTFGFTMTYLSSACFLCAALFSNVLNTPLFRPFGYLGSHSYSTYLWHVPVIDWGVEVVVVRLFGSWINCTLKVIVTVILCFAFGVVMAKIVEIPFLKIRDRFFPSKTQPPVEAGAG